MSRAVIPLLVAIALAACTDSGVPTDANPEATRIVAISGNLAFGDVEVGSSATATLTITNTGNKELEVSDVSVPTGFSRSWVSGTIPSGGSQAVIMTFSPTEPTTYTGTVSVASNATSGTSTLAVSGTGTVAPPEPTRIIGVSGHLAFGNVEVGSSATATLTITNSGTQVLTVSSMTVSGGMHSVLSANWLSGTIPAGGSQQVTVQFAPLAPEAYSGTVTIVSDATSGTSTLAASGTGTSVPPAVVPGYYLWGGPGYAQYLGFFTCVFCVEFAAESVNNQFGTYGSPFSTTSIRNSFSQYGSPYSTYSACNQFATSPPRVYNSNRTVYYGTLTLNQFRPDAITEPSIVTWLNTNVCDQ